MKNLRFTHPAPGLDLVSFIEYIYSKEVYNQPPKNKLEKYRLSGGAQVGKVPPPISCFSKRKVFIGRKSGK
jgi:hypothetical protein